MVGPKKSKFRFGRKENITLDSLSDILNHLYTKRDVPVANLDSNSKEILDALINYVQILYGTQFYEKLYNKTKEIFDNVNEVKPGTVGAYIVGCINAQKNDVSNSVWYCSPNCLEAYVPVNQQPECNVSVITLELNNDGSYTMILNKSSESEKAILFTEKPFVGLSEKEKNKLLSFNIQKVKIYQVSHNKFVGVFPEWTPITSIHDKDENKLRLSLQLARAPSDPSSGIDEKIQTFGTPTSSSGGETGPIFGPFAIISIVIGVILLGILAVSVVIIYRSNNHTYSSYGVEESNGKSKSKMKIVRSEHYAI